MGVLVMATWFKLLNSDQVLRAVVFFFYYLESQVAPKQRATLPSLVERNCRLLASLLVFGLMPVGASFRRRPCSDANFCEILPKASLSIFSLGSLQTRAPM